jgi:hypothetical protein
MGGLLFFRRLWDTPCTDALFVEWVAMIGIGCLLPESLALFTTRFMSDAGSGLTEN